MSFITSGSHSMLCSSPVSCSRHRGGSNHDGKVEEIKLLACNRFHSWSAGYPPGETGMAALLKHRYRNRRPLFPDLPLLWTRFFEKFLYRSFHALRFQRRRHVRFNAGSDCAWELGHHTAWLEIRYNEK